MKEINGCVQEVMDPKLETEVASEEGRTPTPQPPLTNSNSSTPIPTEDPAQEFSLVIKPKGTPLFRLSALYKSRLQFCIFLQLTLLLVMLCKLSEDILDRMDIFILELEELYLPRPLLWEWVWVGHTMFFSIIGLKGISKNSLSSIKSFAAGILIFGIGSVLGAAVYYFNEICEYAEKKSEAEIETWQGYPIALYVYCFVIVAFQAHIFSLYFAWKLIKMWRGKTKKH